MSRESRVPAGKFSLYAREIGQGKPIIVLHGGPDFDHTYLLPELDRLADSFRLIYYDQRGRGRSAESVEADDVTLESDVEDIDTVRRHFHLESPVLLGHSWGAVLALEYAVRYPERVSHLVLMNPAPASAGDFAIQKKTYAEKLGSTAMAEQKQIVTSIPYKQGDPVAVIARYRIHFKPALKRAEDYERLIARLEAVFRSQGKEGILKARSIEDRLMQGSWRMENYDPLSKLHSLNIPSLVIWGDHDIIAKEIPSHIAAAIPNARLIALRDCGHFSYLENPTEVHSALDKFFQEEDGLSGP